MKNAVCTIITKNYLPFAKTLGDSLKALDSLTDFHVLVIDSFDMSSTQLQLDQINLDYPTDLVTLNADKFHACLLKANGHDEYKSLPYGYSTFSNGVPIDNVVRFLLRFEKKKGALFLNPLNVDTEPSFFAWLNSPIKGIEQPVDSPQLTNYLAGIYMNRLDLQKAFPDVGGKNRDGYLSWIYTKAEKIGIHSAYLGK